MASEVKCYRDLIVWQKSMALVTQIYHLTAGLPFDEVCGLRSQIRRSAVSVPSNIAEGYGRNSTKDYIRFLQVAMGSLFEVQTQIEISVNLGYKDRDSIAGLWEATREIERMLSSLIRKIRA